MKNFRCYKDDKKYSFDFNPAKNIALFTGKSNSGKTSLMNAIGWCLYGYETQVLLGTKTEEKSNQEIPNEKSYDSNDETRVSVRITIKVPELPQIATIVVTRHAKFRKGNVFPIYPPDLNIEVYNKHNEVQNYTPYGYETLLSQIRAPKGLETFYMFDGEFLKQTQKFDDEINTGFNKLFRIDAFKQVETSLIELHSSYSKEASKAENISRAAKDKYDELTRVSELKRQRTVEFNDEEKELSNLQKDRTDTAEVARSSLDLVQSKTAYERLKAQRESAEKEKNEYSKTVSQNILQNAYLFNANAMITETLDSIAALEEKVKAKKSKKSKLIGIPPNVQTPFLQELLNDEECICGRTLPPDSSEYRHIQELVPRISEMNERAFVLDLKAKLENVKNANKRNRAEIDDLNKKVKQKIKEIDNFNLEISKITGKYKDIEKEMTIQNPMAKLEFLDGRIRESNSRLEKIRSDIDELNRKIESIKNEITESEGSKNDQAEYMKKMEITSALSSIIKAFSTQAIDKFSELLEREINKLLAANEKLSTFKCERKVISNDQVAFTFKETGSRIHYLGGGLSQLKGIILIAAYTRIITKVAREHLPIPFVIMDHPISDLDTEGIERIAGEIGEMFHNSQVLLFVADTKYDVFKRLAKEYISNKFLITNDKVKKESHITSYE